MNATETVQRAMGYRWVEITGCRIYTRSQAPHFVETTDMSLRCFEGDGPTDPLADTPEGWWEFGQILEWAREQGWRWELDENGIWWCIRDASGFGASFIDRWEVWVDPEPDHLTEREARIEALAEAVGGQRSD